MGGCVGTCGWGVFCAKCCKSTEPDQWHDKFTTTEYEQTIYDNQQEEKQILEQKKAELKSYMTDRQKIKDGDVIAFAGHTFTDDVIGAATDSTYGHVGIVCNSLWDEKKFGKLDGDIVMFETFSSHHGRPVPDAFTGKIRSGTQVHMLYKRLDALCDDSVYVHPLKEPLNPDELQKLKEFLQRVHDEAAHYDYSEAYAIPFRDADQAKVHHANPDDDESMKAFFCSELVAAALQAAGRISSEKDASVVVPGDFGKAPLLGEVVDEPWLLVDAGHGGALERLVSDWHKDEQIRCQQLEIEDLKARLLAGGIECDDRVFEVRGPSAISDTETSRAHTSAEPACA